MRTSEQLTFFPCEKTHFWTAPAGGNAAEFTAFLTLVVSDGTCLQIEARAVAVHVQSVAEQLLHQARVGEF